MKKLVVILVLAWLFANLALVRAQAQEREFTYVIANSENWQDVYSVMQYARFKGVGSDFLVSTRHGPLLLNGIRKENDIRVITSRSAPFVINYPSMILAKGFADADEVVVDNANLELINDLPDVKNFIVVGRTYGYSAIAVAPYAAITNSWVFFADRNNIDEIDSILANRGVENLLIYGFVDRQVRDQLAKYNPEIINTGDRFRDNIEIVKKYMQIKPVKQVVFTNGEFIEKEIMTGFEPVLFTGKQDVPPQIRDYIKSSDIEVGVLIGADLVGPATNIRRSTGISVIVKFARGARARTGPISPVEGLDLFYLPTPIMELSVYSAKYNTATSQLELTYKSDSNIPIYFKGTLTPIVDGEEKARVGDVEPVFIAPGDFKTVSYSDIDFNGDKLELEVFTLYGEAPSALEKILETRVDVEKVNVLDRCKIDLKKIIYSKPKKAFFVTVENPSEVDCWVDVELRDVLIDGLKRTLGSEGATEVKKGKSAKIKVEQEMADDDLKKNQFVEVIAYYGERESSLVNAIKAKLKLEIVTISFATIGLFALIIVVVAALIFLFMLWRRRKKEEEF
ncbi:hypothetical protein D6817_04360 [Candidatus Pacearchaeota archaeon]|nr:MAG: hypothetical protein D6817_04360 [Candidatus Pacearchaeota archaeon]